eukprot:5070373-Prymnesium_polylepis.1
MDDWCAAVSSRARWSMLRSDAPRPKIAWSLRAGEWFQVRACRQREMRGSDRDVGRIGYEPRRAASLGGSDLKKSD